MISVKREGKVINVRQLKRVLSNCSFPSPIVSRKATSILTGTEATFFFKIN